MATIFCNNTFNKGIYSLSNLHIEIIAKEVRNVPS